MPEVIIVTDGTATVTLSSYKVMDYVPKEGTGAESVEEPIKLYFPSTSTARADLRILHQLFSQAERYAKTSEGPRVWVEFTEPGGDPWISYITEGRVEWDADTLKPWWLPAGKGKATLFWSREPKWYKFIEESIPLSNIHGSNQVNGLAVDNRNDASQDNHAFIDSADVEGDLPTPAKILFTNTTAGLTVDQLLVGHHIYDGSSAGGLPHIYEGEDATGDDATVTDTGDAAASGTFYGAITTATYDTEIRACYWTASSAHQIQWGRKEFRIFLRLRSAPTAGTYARIKVQAVGATSDYIWEGEQVLLDTGVQLQELALTRLPPDRLLASLAPTPLEIALYLTLPSGASLALDYIAFMPLAGYRQFSQWPLGLAEDDALVDDGFEGETYTYDDSANQYRGYPAPLGAKIMLFPGKDQQFHFLWRDASGNSLPAWTGEVEIVYHPCRRTPL